MDFSGNPVVKTVIQPLPGLRLTWMCFGSFITVKRYTVDSTMEIININRHFENERVIVNYSLNTGLTNSCKRKLKRGAIRS